MLNLGNFNEERQRGLASYLAYLAGQIQSLAQVPALSAFLAPAPLGQPVVAQGVVQPVMAQPVPGTAAVTAGAPVTMQAQQAFQPSAPVATPVATPIAVPVAPVVTGVAVASPYAAPANAQPYPQPAYPVQAASAAPASGGASGGGFGAGLLGAGAVAGVLAGVAGAAMMHGSSHSSHHEYCYKCEGRGFRHNSSMNHNERPDKRCFFCEDCDACRGRGMHASPRHHHGSHHHHHGPSWNCPFFLVVHQAHSPMLVHHAHYPRPRRRLHGHVGLWRATRVLQVRGKRLFPRLKCLGSGTFNHSQS